MITLPSSARVAGGAVLLLAGLALGGCQTTGAGVAAPAARASTGPMTHQKAALACWMETEHGHADLPLDKRADIVDQCIKQKMQGG